MGWTSNGYTPDSYDVIIGRYYDAFESEFEFTTRERFNGSKGYEVCYAASQIDMQYQEVFSEVFNKVALWMQEVNFKINSPSTTPIAIQQKFLSKFGLNIGIKPKIEADRGKSFIAIDYTPSPALNEQIALFLATDCISGGIATMGDIVVPVSIGGQQFDYKWVKAIEKTVKFKVTITVSRSAAEYIESATDIRDRFIKNYEMLYRIGYDIEPESYYEINRDAKYASEILTQYSLDDGSTWLTLPHKSLYSDKFVPSLDTGDIKIVRPS